MEKSKEEEKEKKPYLDEILDKDIIMNPNVFLEPTEGSEYYTIETYEELGEVLFY
jgi:hypothetical protein